MNNTNDQIVATVSFLGRSARPRRGARGNSSFIPSLGSPRSSFRSSAASCKLSTSVAAVLENLEGRQLLSSASISSGTINVQATNGNDTVLISKDAANGTMLDVTVDGTLTQFSSGSASRIQIQLGAGVDLVQVSSSNGAVWQHLIVNGGSGTDTIYGSQNSNWVLGTGGGNITFIGTGGDYVDGGTGHATVYDPHGATVLNGTLMPAGATPPSVAQAAPVVTPTPTPTSTPAVVTSSSSSSSVSPAGFFPVGVFYQPVSSFSNWKALGVNTLVGYTGEGGPTIAQWSADAKAVGLDYIRQPSPNPYSDIGDPNLLAWLQPTDEPELNGVSAASLEQYYLQLKSIDANIPVMTNYDGGFVVGYQGNLNASDYAAYTAATDWVSNDIYPVSGWGLPNQLGLVGQAVSTLSADSGGKRQFAFIETSNQNLWWVPNDQGVTPAQFQGELWDAVIHGATGITYFPQQIGGTFLDNATPANVAAVMTAQDAVLQQYGSALLSSPNNGVTVSASSPLEATTRVYGGKTYVFVLNLSNQAVYQKVTINGVPQNATAVVGNQNRTVQLQNGSFNDYFAADGINIYQIG